MTRRASAVSLIACVASLACSSESHGDGEGYLGGEAGVVTCPVRSSDNMCTGPAPSYATDVAPILAAHCTGCHSAKGEYPGVRLDSYSALVGSSAHLSTGLLDAQGCLMPPAPLPPVPDPEVAVLSCWINTCLQTILTSRKTCIR